MRSSWRRTLLIAGATIVCAAKFSASRWVDQVRENGVTVTNFLGVMMDFTWKQPPRPDDADNPLRCICRPDRVVDRR